MAMNRSCIHNSAIISNKMSRNDVLVVKLYDWLFYDIINCMGVLGNNLIFIFICLLIVMLFSQSYKKQTDYIRSRVEEYTNSKQIQ